MSYHYIYQFRKRLTRLSLICVVCFIGMNSMHAQMSQINKTKKSRQYEVDGEVMHFFDMKEVFAQDFRFIEKYNKARRAAKSADFLGYTTLGLIGGGAFLIAVDNDTGISCEFLCLTTGDVIGLISIFLIAPITGTTALIVSSTAHKRKKNLINEFNNAINEYGQVIQQPTLKFTGAHTGYGLGLAVQF